MRNLPFLLIALTLTIITGVLVYAGIVYANAPLTQQAQYAGRAGVAGASIFFFMAMTAGFLGFALWIAALVHLLTSQTLQGTDKIVWTLVLIFLHVIGAILYFTLRPFKIARSPEPAGTPVPTP
jgi:hypothetical protein